MSSAKLSEQGAEGPSIVKASPRAVDPAEAARREILAGIQRLQGELLGLRKQLAATFCAQALPEDEFMVLLCRCGTTRVAFPLDNVDEVIMVPALAPLPEAPPWVAGVLNLRGRTIQVLDVTARLTRQAREVELSDYVVVGGSGQRALGFIVQDLGEPTAIRPQEVHAPGDGLSVAPYLTGLIQRGDDQIALLDTESLVIASSMGEVAA